MKLTWLDHSRKGGDSQIFAKSEAAAVLQSLEGLKIDLVIKLKGERNNFFGQKLGPKIPTLPKIHMLQTADHQKLVDLSKWPQYLTYYEWSKICIPLWQPEVPQKYNVLYFVVL